MPFTAGNAGKYNKGLSDNQKRKWAKIAQSVYSKCMEGGGKEKKCAKDAIIAANSAIKDHTFAEAKESMKRRL